MRIVTVDDLRLQDPGLRARIDTLLDAPAELMLPERLLLYALVRAVRPARCLEVGSHFGGSTAVICAALDDVGAGALVCVDPKPLIGAELLKSLAHRARMVIGTSPEMLPEAAAQAGGFFDFVFIDGDHSRLGVSRDIDGAVDAASPGAHFLLHDAHSPKIKAGIQDSLDRHRGRLVDCGLLSTLTTAPYVAPDGTTPLWGGLRMLRLAPSQAERD